MNRFTVVAAFLILVLGTPVFANYYVHLQKDFKASGDNISLSDFRDYGHPHAKLCVEYTKEQPLDEANVRIGLHSRTSDGPGPGLPPVEVVKLLLTTYDHQDLGPVADSATLKLKPKEIKVTQTNPEKSVVLLRKQKELIYFKRTRMWTETTHDQATDKDVTVEKTADLYGYCYPRPTAVATTEVNAPF